MLCLFQTTLLTRSANPPRFTMSPVLLPLSVKCCGSRAPWWLSRTLIALAKAPGPHACLKLPIYKLGLWRTFDFIRTRGKRYQISAGDGLFYSYSVYDSLRSCRKWADRVLLVSGDCGHPGSWLHPLLTAKGVILVAIRDARPEKSELQQSLR